jgi:hypothetical protein
MVRYLEPAARPAAPPPPRTFAGLWLLVAALVAAGLLVAWLLAGRLGYLSGEAGEAASAGQQVSLHGASPDG